MSISAIKAPPQVQAPEILLAEETQEIIIRATKDVEEISIRFQNYDESTSSKKIISDTLSIEDSMQLFDDPDKIQWILKLEDYNLTSGNWIINAAAKKLGYQDSLVANLRFNYQQSISDETV